VLNPESASVERSFLVGSDPSKVIASSGGSSAFVWSQGQSKLCEYSMAGGSNLGCLDLGRESGSPRFVASMAAVPGTARSVVVSTQSTLHVFEGSREVSQLASWAGWVQPVPEAARVYGTDFDTSFKRLEFSSTGLKLLSQTPGLFGSEPRYPYQILYYQGLIYTNTGQVFHAETLKPAGQYVIPGIVGAGTLIAMNPERNHVYFLVQSSPLSLFVFDRLSFAKIGKLDLSEPQLVSSLTICGSDCLAWRDSDSIYLLRVSSLTLTEPPLPSPPPPGPAFVNGAMVLKMRANGIAWDPLRNQVWVGTGFTGGLWANSIYPLNWETGEEGDAVPVPGEPKKLAITSDGKYAYTGLDFDFRVQRIDLNTRRADLLISYRDPAYAAYPLTDTPADLLPVPGEPEALVVAGTVRSMNGGVAIYDGVGRRPDSIGDAFICDQLQWGPEPSTLYCTYTTGSPSYLRKLEVGPNGVRLTDKRWPISGGFLTHSVYNPADRLFYGGEGSILDPETGEKKGILPASGWAALDPAQNTIGLLRSTSSGVELVVVDLATRQIKRTMIAAATGAYPHLELVNAGPGRFAARHESGYVILFDLAR
jgi:hypothetical protein